MTHALRQLLKTPGFSLLAILTLALGIGLNTSMFSLMNVLLLEPLPFRDSDRLVRIYRTTPQSPTANHSAPDFLHLLRHVKGTDAIAAYRLWSYSLTQPGRSPVNLNAVRVTPEFFPALGMPPQLGRYFTREEDVPGNRVIVLSHATWQSQFAGDPGVVGRTVRVDGEPTTVIGVTPKALSSIFLWGPGEAFRPMALTDEQRTNKVEQEYRLLARLRPDTSVEQFNAQLGAVVRQLAEHRSAEHSQDGLQATTLFASTKQPGFKAISWLMLGLAGFVLLIACANLANLQLARTIARSQEFAIRSALGASRLRMLQPVVLESLILSLCGGALGVLFAMWSNDWMAANISRTFPLNLDFSLNWRILTFAVTLAVATGLVFGTLPAFVLAHIRVNDALKSGTRGNTGGPLQNRLRHALIVGQFALALVLLAGASLFIRGVDRMLQRDIGWDRHGLTQGQINLPTARYDTPEKVYGFHTRLQERLAALPGAQSATIGWTLPTVLYLASRNFVVEGKEPPPPGREPRASVNGVMPSFLPTLPVRLLSGRNFTDADTITSPRVIIISESMAKALFPGENALGRRLGTTDPANRAWAEIVGIMPDFQMAVTGTGLDRGSFVVYQPLAQEPWGYVTFAVRSSSPAALVEPIRKLIESMDPDLPVQQLSTVDDYVKTLSATSYMINTILTGFATLGLFLAALGLYGVIARLVAQRRNEIGVRVALGAQSRDVVWLILRTGLILTVLGTVIGTAGAFGLAQILSLMADSGSAPADPFAILGMAALLMVVAVFACWIPARRAAKVDPLVALRAE